jgi:flagellin-like hook-associated protein FlgL
MAGIYPIPAGRSSDILLNMRTMFQLQSEQQMLLKVQQQLATGQRLHVPSDDPSSSVRAISLQRLLEQKEQIQTNLNTSQSYLSATDTALSGVSDLLGEVRGLAVRAADTTTSELERQAISLQVGDALRRMVEVGNESFRGRYLFAGSDSTTRPFEFQDGYVGYRGNNTAFNSYADLDMLFQTNLPGQELFGAVSAEVRGIDVNATLTTDTRLADLRGGVGIDPGRFIISDGTHRSTVDISSAETIGDVVRLMEASAPEGRTLRARLTATGLTISIDATGGGSLTIVDELGSTAAAELGIARPSGLASEPITSSDLDPILRPTTRLNDILGVRARSTIQSAGPNNDIILEALAAGADSNGYHLQFVDDDLLFATPGLTAGNERVALETAAVPARGALTLTGVGNDLILTANSPGTDFNHVQFALDASSDLGDSAIVSYDPTNKILRMQIDDTDETTLGSLMAAIDASGFFTAAADTSRGEVLNPAATVRATDSGARGSTGNTGGADNTIFVFIESGATSAAQVVAALNADADVSGQFVARLDELDSTSAALAGTRPVDVSSSGTTTDGSGVEWDRQSGLQILNGEEVFEIDVRHAETVQDLLNVLNASDASLLAEINAEQNGINVRSRLSGGRFSIGENGGSTATDLGLRTMTGQTELAELDYGRGAVAAEGTDFIIRRVDGVELEIDISTAATVADVINLINSHPDNLDPATSVTARLRSYGNGIELVSDNPAGPAMTTVTRGPLSYAAWGLGLVPHGADESSAEHRSPALPAVAELSFADPNHVNTAMRLTATQPGTAMNGVEIEFRDTLAGDTANVTFDGVGRRLIINITNGQTTANTVVAAVIAEGTFQAALDVSDDPTNDGSGTLVAPPGVAGMADGGAPELVQGTDANPMETHGIFNSLIKLNEAIENDNVEEIQRIVQLLDNDFDRLSFGRAELAARAQGLDALQTRHQDEQIDLSTILSKEIDVDLAEAASDFAARQASYQASLQTMSNLYRLTLLDFL